VADARVEPGLSSGVLDGIDLVVFDKDGTLIDFHAMWVPWFEELSRRLELATGPQLRDDLWRALSNDPASGETLPLGAIAGTTNEQMWHMTVAAVAVRLGNRARAVAVVSDAWFLPDPVTSARALTDLGVLFGDIHRSGRLVAVITADDRLPTERTLGAFGVTDAVDALVCGDDGLPNKPAPDTLLRACSLLGVPAQRAAIVGDMPGDLLMAHNAGAGRAIGVLSGAGRPDHLAPLADALLGSIAEFGQLLALSQPGADGSVVQRLDARPRDGRN